MSAVVRDNAADHGHKAHQLVRSLARERSHSSAGGLRVPNVSLLPFLGNSSFTRCSSASNTVRVSTGWKSSLLTTSAV